MWHRFNRFVGLAGTCIGFCCSASPGANIALWSQTSPDYVPASADVRDNVAVWPPEVARKLNYYAKVEAPAEMAEKLREVLHHAMSVWESAADIAFVPVTDPRSARLVVNIEYHAGSGHYHGGGKAWPPVRRADGTFEVSHVNLYFGGEADQADDWREDSWVWTAAHELGHALGLWHEFERPDVSQYLSLCPGQSRTAWVLRRENSRAVQWAKNGIIHTPRRGNRFLNSAAHPPACRAP